MKTSEQTSGEQYVYIPFTSIQNIASLQGLTIPKDVMIRIPTVPEGQIPFLDLSQASTLTLAAGNVDNGEINQNDIAIPIEDTLKPVYKNNTVEQRKDSKSKPEVIKCILCGESFTKGVNYKRHMEIHRNTKKFKCKYCFESYNVEDNFKLHMAIHNSGTPTCPLCNRKFQRLASLKSHLLMHEIEETFTCKECQAEFDKETDYYKHLEKHNILEEQEEHTVPYVCSYCNYMFDDIKQYKEHLSYHIKLKKLVFNSKQTKRKSTTNKNYPHKCSVCGKSFPKSCLLERHLRVHSGEKPFECPKCKKKFTQKNTLTIHLAKHDGYKPFKCTLCPASYFQKGNLRVHVQKTHTTPQGVSEVYNCTQCTSVFKKIAPLNAHVTRAHSGTIHVDEVDAVTEKLKELRQLTAQQAKPTEKPIRMESVISSDHTENASITDTLVKLSECGSDGLVRQYVVTQRKVRESKSYICSYCTKEIKKPSDLMRHLRIHTNEKPFECLICKQTFTLKSTLQTHLNTHIGKKEYQCIVCFNQFSSMRNLNVHLRTHGDASQVQTLRYKCSSCTKLFTSMSKVKQHMEIHNCSGTGPEREHLGSQMLTNALFLKQPLVERDDGVLEEVAEPKSLAPYFATDGDKERPFKCHLCTAAFIRSEHLKRHMNSHSDEKTFKCNICSESYSSASGLRNHMHVHSGERKFPCGFCCKKFATKSLLQRHISNKHKDRKNYICPYCDRRYKRLDQCRSHLASAHTSEMIDKGGGKQQLPESVILQSNLSEDMLNLKAVQTADSFLEEALKINSEQINRTKEELEKLGGLKGDREGETTAIVEDVVDDPSSKQQGYSITLPDGIQLHNVGVAQNLSDGTQNYSTIYISYNDIQQMGSDIFDPLSSQVEYQTVDSVLNEPQDVNILFVDSLTQNNELTAEPQTFEPFNQVMFTDGIQPAASDINIPITISSEIDKPETVTVSEIPKETRIKLNFDTGSAQQKLILKANGQKLISDNENIVITLNGDALKTSDLAYLQNFMGLDQAEEIATLNDDTGLVGSAGDILIGDGGDGTICCAVCKVPCANIADLAKHRCLVTSDLNGDNNAVNTELTVKEDQLEEQTSSVINAINVVQEADEHDTLATLKPENVKTEKRQKTKLETECRYCSKHFKKLSDLERHLRVHTGEKPFVCTKCGKSFSLKSTLQSHMRTHDPSELKKVSCHICNSTYSCKASLKTHMSIHTGLKPYGCGLCPARFRTSAHRKTHVDNHAKTNQKKKTTLKSNIKTTLTYANNYFESLLAGDGDGGENNELNESSSVVNLESVIEPTVSNQIDPTESLAIGDSLPIEFLQLHNSTFLLPDTTGDVLGQLQFDMETIPEKVSESDQQLTTVDHVADQVNVELPSLNLTLFECSICKKQYSSKSVLRKHQKNHKKFSCPKCGKEFDTLEAVEKHSKVHLGYRPFSCLHCANSFSEAASLKTHMKRIHKLPA